MTDYPIKSPRKLIEVALPLDAINAAAAQEKGNPFLKGHPRNLHQWWSRKPMAVARAVLFAQLVNDPGYQQGGGFKYGKNKKDAAIERKRLFKIIEDLVLWENTTNEEVLERARTEIRRSWREVCELNKDHPQAAELFNPDKLPALHDPFAGGGAIPLEAQRLGLEAYASDLNPVAVLINKAMIEIPPKFAGLTPVGPDMEPKKGKKLALSQSWPGASGLAEDVRRYATWMRRETEKCIGDLYPTIEVTREIALGRDDLQPLIGQKLTVVAWLWARTVKSPNPAFSGVAVPLTSTFILYNKKNREAYVQPVIDGESYRFMAKIGTPPSGAERGTKSRSSGSSFLCLMSGVPIAFDYIREEAKAGRMGTRLMAMVAEGHRGRVYLSPTPEMEALALTAQPQDVPETELPKKALGFRIQEYGMSRWSDLFTHRQLAALTTLISLVTETRKTIRRDAVAAGMSDDNKGLDAGGRTATAYAEAVSIYLAFAIDKLSDYNNMICTWNPTNQNVGHLFAKHAIPMAWNFAETSPLTGGLSIDQLADGIARTIQLLPVSALGKAFQADSAVLDCGGIAPVISTDPPYYDNMGYACHFSALRRHRFSA